MMGKSEGLDVKDDGRILNRRERCDKSRKT